MKSSILDSTKIRVALLAALKKASRFTIHTHSKTLSREVSSQLSINAVL
jgi:hypothetical protein